MSQNLGRSSAVFSFYKLSAGDRHKFSVIRKQPFRITFLDIWKKRVSTVKPSQEDGIFADYETCSLRFLLFYILKHFLKLSDPVFEKILNQSTTLNETFSRIAPVYFHALFWAELCLWKASLFMNRTCSGDELQGFLRCKNSISIWHLHIRTRKNYRFDSDPWWGSNRAFRK